MKTFRLPLLLTAALATFTASAAPDPAFEPFAFLVGHCWKGTMPNGSATDQHCFAWMYEGKFVRDRHVVRDGAGKAVYEGETLYYWNAASKQFEYLYVTAQGGHAHGRALPDGDAIDFPAATLVTATKSSAFRGRWKRSGDKAYEIVREYETDKGWVPVKMEMRRVE